MPGSKLLYNANLFELTAGGHCNLDDSLLGNHPDCSEFTKLAIKFILYENINNFLYF